MRALRGGDQLAHAGLIAVAQQLDRVGIAVDDLLEERLAVLIGRQRALGPSSRLVQEHGQARVGLAVLLRDLGLDPLRQRGRGARGGDRDRERPGAHDRRQDEVAQRWDVDDVDEHRPPLRVVVHADVDVGVVGGGDHHERRLEILCPVLAPDPGDRALGRELLQLRDGVRGDEHHAAVGRQQALDLLQADLAPADHHAAPAGEPQARDVERGLEHALHARLIADPLAELADALLAGVGLGGHVNRGYRRPSGAPAIGRVGLGRTCFRIRGVQEYFTDESLLRQVVGHRLTGLSGPRALLVMAAHPVAFAGFFAHTGALDDPYARLQRTATVMNAVAFGPRRRADRLTAHVRAMHRRVRGELPEAAGRFPAGTPYRADDPELLLWILAALAE